MELSDLLSLHDAIIPFFEEKWKKGTENERYMKGDHWTDAEKREIAAQNRQPYSIAAMATKLNTIEATQRQARTQCKVETTGDPADEVKAELASIMVRDVERISKFPYVESEVFASGMKIQYAAVEIYQDYSKLNSETKIRKLDYKDVVWDRNSKHYELEDALFTAKVEKEYRYLIEAEYGKLDTAEDLGQWGREKNPYYVRSNPNNKPEFDIISKFTHYQKVMRTYHHVLFPDSEGLFGISNPHIGKFESKEEAETQLRKLNTEYLMKGFDFEGSVEDKDEPAYDKYEFVYNKILKVTKLDCPTSPIKVYRSFHFEDDFWCFMDMLKSPQKFMDRLLMQIDYSFGSDIKTIYQLNTSALGDGETPQTAKRKAEMTGGVIFSNSNDPILQAIRAQGINPQWLEVARIMQGFIEDFSGGRSFQGLSEGASESGKAINIKKGQGVLLTFILVDNLNRFKRSVYEHVLWSLGKYDTVEHQVTIQNEELSPEMMQVLQENQIYVPSKIHSGKGAVKVGGLGFLKDADFELTITEAALTTSEKELKYMSWLELGRSNPFYAQLPTYNKILLSYNPDISKRDKDALIKEIEGIAQAQSQAAEQEQKNTQAELELKAAEVGVKVKNSNIDAAKVLQEGMMHENDKKNS